MKTSKADEDIWKDVEDLITALKATKEWQNNKMLTIDSVYEVVFKQIGYGRIWRSLGKT